MAVLAGLGDDKSKNQQVKLNSKQISFTFLGFASKLKKIKNPSMEQPL
jgi:hypothetical protein